MRQASLRLPGPSAPANFAVTPTSEAATTSPAAPTRSPTAAAMASVAGVNVAATAVAYLVFPGLDPAGTDWSNRAGKPKGADAATDAATPAACPGGAIGTVQGLFAELGREAAATRRVRDALPLPYEPQDAELPGLVHKIASPDRTEGREALTKVWQLTVLTRSNRAANHAALAELGGVMLAVDFAVARLESCDTKQDEDDAVMALLVLENLSCNARLHHAMAHNSNLLRFLVEIMRDQKAYAPRVNAAKVLVNLTFSSPALQHRVVQAGALPQAVRLLHAPEAGLARQGVWLLSHLTAGQGCAARCEVARQAEVLARLKSLLLTSDDAATKARGCEVVCNLARGDARPLDDLVRSGMTVALLQLVDPKLEARQEADVVAPALLALAALATGHTATARSLLAEPRLTLHLEVILDYSNLMDTRDYALSRVMVAAHTLIYALGDFALRHKLGKPLGAAANGAAGRDAARRSPQAEYVLQGSGHATFATSLAALGLKQPKYHAASLGKELGGPHGFVAFTNCQVNIELLPVLKHDNARMVINACARLYQIAVCLVDHPEGRAVFTNASLIVALKDLLASEHSGVLHAALSLVDALAALPELWRLLVKLDVLGTLQQLSDAREEQPPPQAVVAAGGGAEAAEGWEPQGPAAGRRAVLADPLVGLLAERAMVTLYLVVGQGPEARTAHAG